MRVCQRVYSAALELDTASIRVSARGGGEAAGKQPQGSIVTAGFAGPGGLSTPRLNGRGGGEVQGHRAPPMQDRRPLGHSSQPNGRGEGCRGTVHYRCRIARPWAPPPVAGNGEGSVGTLRVTISGS
eukprot:gene8312-biopygen12129